MNPIGPNFQVARASLALLLIVGVVAAQEAPKGVPYPEHGKVIATHLGIETVGSAGSVGSLKRWIYRVDCGALYYDLQGGGKPSLSLGQDVTFRIEELNAYLNDGNKGQRYRIVGSGKSDQKQSPQSN
jgi:hypothetical protein